MTAIRWTEAEMIEATLEHWGMDPAEAENCEVVWMVNEGRSYLIVRHEPTGRTSNEAGDTGRWFTDGTPFFVPAPEDEPTPDTTRETGFHATDDEVYFITPGGRAWIVASPDIPGIEEIEDADIPADATDCGELLTGAEQADYLRQVEAESGEKLIEAD